MTSGLSGYPSLQPAYIIKLNSEITPVGNVGTTFSGSSFVQFLTPSGNITTVDGFEPHIEADVVFGGDWLYFDPDQAHSRPDVKGIAKTSDGTAIKFGYKGVAAVTEALRDVFFNGKPTSVPFGSATTYHYFEVGDPRLKDLERHSWVGNGRFLYEEGRIVVETRVSKVIASTDAD